MEKNYLKIILTVLVAILLFFPVWFFGGRIYYIESVLLMVAAGLLFLFYHLDSAEKRQIEIKQGIILIWSLFIFALLITLSYSISFYRGFDWLMLYLAYFVLFMVAGLTSFSLKELKFFIAVLVSGAVCLVLFGIYMYLFNQYTRLTSTFYWPNPFAGYLLMILPLMFGLFLRSRVRMELLLYGLISILLLAAFILTESRAAYLSLIIPFFAVFWLLRDIPKKELLIKLLVVFIGVLALTTLLFSAKQQKFSWFFMSKSGDFQTSQTDFSIASRIDYWKAGWEIFKDNPWLGTGPATFSLVYPGYQKSVLGFTKYAHNHYIQVLAEMGLVGTVPFYLLIFSLLWLGIKIIRREKDCLSEEGFYITLLFLGILGSIIHNGADFDWYFSANFIIFWILAGLVYGYFLKMKNNESGV